MNQIHPVGAGVRTERDGRRRRPVGRRLATAVLAAVLLPLMGGGPAAAQQSPGLPGSRAAEPGLVASERPAQLEAVTFAQRLDEQLPLDAAFRDEEGRTVRLGDYFGRKPVILAFVYYECPMLCSQVMYGISSALKVLPFTAGDDFEVVLVSFDPRETPAHARARKATHLAQWSAEQTSAGWHLLTGEEADIRRVTEAAGFTYRWDDRTGQFAHVSGLLVATPEGRLSRYFYGVQFSPRELRMALVESGEGRIGSRIDELLLYCFHYNPEEGRYGLVVMNLLRLGGALTVVLLGGFILVMRRREMRAGAERAV
jgi:protein SCO1